VPLKSETSVQWFIIVVKLSEIRQGQLSIIKTVGLFCSLRLVTYIVQASKNKRNYKTNCHY